MVLGKRLKRQWFLPGKMPRQLWQNSPVLASGLEAEDAEGVGDDHLLLAVVGRGHTLEELQALKGSGTTGGLVGDL